MNPFLKRVVEAFDLYDTGFRTSRTQRRGEIKVDVGRPEGYYGWYVNAPFSRVDLDLNFTAADRQINLARLRTLRSVAQDVEQGVGLELETDEEGWEAGWTCGGFSLPYEGSSPPLELAARAAEVMKLLIERTLSLLESSPPQPKSEITFLITEDEIDGGFNARAHWPDGNRDIFTQGDNRDDLLQNIRDAIDCSFDDHEQKPESIRLHFIRDEVIAR